MWQNAIHELPNILTYRPNAQIDEIEVDITLSSLVNCCCCCC